MVELPRHVHRITKRRPGRAPIIYTFYTRHRNTPAALPSIIMPEPLSAEFAEAYAICEALEPAGEVWSLFGVDMPNHKDKSFWAAARKVYKAKLRREHGNAKDFTGLADAFEQHEQFTTLANSTQRGYRAYRKMVEAAWAYDMPIDLTTVDAQLAIDALGETPATANQFRAYLSRLMSFGIPRGFCITNPVQFTEKIPGGEPWSPWPDWAFEILFSEAPFNLLMPAISALFTGQRQGDVLKMMRPKKTDDLMEVSAQKTGTTVWIPIHSEFRKWINRAPTASVQLHVGVRGMPYATTDGFRAEWQRLMSTEPFKRFRDERIVFHGLRKNAVINLLEVGCTETQVGAIVNMSEQMVRHYGKEVSTRALARDAMKLLEARWAEVRPAVMEQEQNANWKPAVRIGNRWQRSRPEK